MPDTNDLKQRLRLAVAQARKSISEQQLNEAVQELVKKAAVDRQDLREVGRKVANDQEIFATTDIDDINNILRRER